VGVFGSCVSIRFQQVGDGGAGVFQTLPERTKYLHRPHVQIVWHMVSGGHGSSKLCSSVTCVCDGSRKLPRTMDI
jgi:hypothetical protein